MTRHCKIPDCDRPRRTMRSPYSSDRLESKFCKHHACHSADSYYEGDFVLCENVARPNSRYCAYHPKCRVQGCSFRRLIEDDVYGRFYCDGHTCRVKDCAIPASGHDKRCEMHKECARGGCTNYRVKNPSGHGWLPVCADHMVRHCYVSTCHHHASGNSVFCQYHKCMMATCGGSKHPGSNYCAAHTCGMDECYLPVNHPQLVLPGKPRGCIYCSVHECRSRGCHSQASIANGHCLAHGCSVRGCPRPRSSESHAGAYCIDHYTDSVRRSAEQVGREKESAAAAERKRKADEKAREKEREDRIRRQRQEELDHLAAERDAAKEARDRYHKHAQRLAEESERRREIAELERQLLEKEREREREHHRNHHHHNHHHHHRRRSFGASTSVGSASVADHPIHGVPTYNDMYPPSPVSPVSPVTDHVYDTSDGYCSSGDSEYEMDDGYLHAQYRRRSSIPGVRHLKVRYSAA